MAESFHWADSAAEKVIREFKEKKYTCAAGVTPSGTVHIGNFREVITVDLVAKALNNKNKKTRFIYVWDDFDRLRKIPSNVPKTFKKYLGMPISDIPDPWKCHKGYADHFEKEFEEYLGKVDISPVFLRESERYRACYYSDEVKTALVNKEKIAEILNKFRKEPLEEDWYPALVYCEKCNKDSTKVLNYDNNYSIEYKCECGNRSEIDFRKKGVVKLRWRTAWPARWFKEKVAFEPGGKDFVAPGSSRHTGEEIIKEIWNRKAPVFQMYDYIILKGKGGKMASSKGEVITLKEVLDVYEPEIVRYLFASTKPNKEFSISFDNDVIKIYEDFDKAERVYFGIEKSGKLAKEKRIYELSCVDEIPKKMPFQPSFRHLTTLLQIYEGDIDKVIKYYDKENKERVKKRAVHAWNWITKYADEDMRFKIDEKSMVKLNNKEKEALSLLVDRLKKKEFDEDGLFEEFYEICKEVGIEPKEFFKISYKVLINKKKGPRLSSFILAIGKDRVVKLLNSKIK